MALDPDITNAQQRWLFHNNLDKIAGSVRRIHQITRLRQHFVVSKIHLDRPTGRQNSLIRRNAAAQINPRMITGQLVHPNHRLKPCIKRLD